MENHIEATLKVKIQAKSKTKNKIIESRNKTVPITLEKQEMDSLEKKVCAERVTYEEVLADFLRTELHSKTDMTALEEKYAKKNQEYGELYIDIVPLARVVWKHKYAPKYPKEYWISILNLYKQIGVNYASSLLISKNLIKVGIIFAVIVFIALLLFIPTYPLGIIFH